MHIEVEKLLRDLPFQPQRINELLEKHGFAPFSGPQQALYKWKTRQTIPTDRLLQLLYISKFEGKSLDILDYAIRPENGRVSR